METNRKFIDKLHVSVEVVAIKSQQITDDSEKCADSQMLSSLHFQSRSVYVHMQRQSSVNIHG